MEKNTLNELVRYQTCVFRFLQPFDITKPNKTYGGAKVKQKIDDMFRSEEDIRTFCRVRSVVSIMKKHNQDMLETLWKLIEGKTIDCSLYQPKRMFSKRKCPLCAVFYQHSR